MRADLSDNPITRASWRSVLGPALVVSLAAVMLRVVYLIALCPYNLVEDEAQYWLWAQHPGWSYYSKGPGVAWAIWASTQVFGDGAWAVRLPTALASGVAMFAGAVLAAAVVIGPSRPAPGSGPWTLQRAALARRAAVLAALAVGLMPAYQLAFILMTIDGPYVACWAVACAAGWFALERRSRGAWVVLGAALGVGFLFKYTILLLPPGIAIYALVRRRELSLARGWGLGLAAAVVLALGGLGPVLVWNADNDWPTVKHLLGHLGVAGGDQPTTGVEPDGDDAGPARGYTPAWTLNYIATQFGVAGPWLGLALVALVRRRRYPGGGPEHRAGEAFLLWTAGPILLFYLAVSGFTEPEGNWPIAAYATLMPLAAWEFARWTRPVLPRAAGEPRRLNTRRFLWRFGVIAALAALPLLHRADLAARAINAVKPGEPIVLGRLMPAPIVAEHVGELMERVRTQTGREPFVMAQHYGRASQVSYYLKLDPPAMSMSAYMWGRKSHFDFWPFTDPRRAELLGRPAVLLSNDRPYVRERWEAMFERVEPVGRLRGEHKRDRVAYLGYGYRGVGAIVAPGDRP
jgi:4-amino-4-deoxy-L-arabinose transferase-like glycosyltransferase